MRRVEDHVFPLVVAAVRFADALERPATEELAAADQNLIDTAVAYAKSLSPRTRARLARSRTR